MNAYVTTQQEETLLHRFQHWAQLQPDRPYMIQPMPDGSILSITWAQAWYQVQCFSQA